MRIRFLIAMLLGVGAILSGGALLAQGAADSLLYRQAKLEIWCETIRFVYSDYGADSLVQSLDCQDWVALEESIRPNYLQTKAFYLAVEKPEIYTGYTTYNAKLQKLVEEISKKLKASHSRVGKPGRLRMVDSLQVSLLELAAAPTSILSVQADTAPVVAEDNAEETEINTVSALRQEAAEKNKPLEDEQMDWMEILQWALLALLTAGLAGLWMQNRKLTKELEIRMNRRKQEISAITRIKESDKPKPEGVKPKVVNEPKAMTAGEVTRLVRAEIDKIREQQKIRRQQFSKAGEAPENVMKPPQEESRPAAPPPAQGKAGTGAKEMEGAETGTAKDGQGLMYDKLPFKGGFHQNHLSPQRHPDSIYSIQVLKGKPDEAEFWVTEDQEVQKYAMQNGLSFFEEACEYTQLEESPSRVRNLERGRLRKNGHLWQIEKKVKVSFE